MGMMRKLLGTNSKREVKKITPIVDKIEALSDEYKALTDEQLRAKTDEFKARLAAGATLDDILPEAFATCREAADRVLGLRPYRVQLIGGIILHQGRIAEMKTGEGKTLVATLPAYLNALTGEGRPHCHRQRLPGQARLRVDGQGLPVPGSVRWSDRPRPDQRQSARPLMTPTSPTAPTTRSVSTTSVTTWPSMIGIPVQRRPDLRHRGRGGLHPHR